MGMPREEAEGPPLRRELGPGWWPELYMPWEERAWAPRSGDLEAGRELGETWLRRVFRRVWFASGFFGVGCT